MSDPEHRDRTGNDATALAAAIAALGVGCSLEARGGLALLVPAPADLAKLLDPETRRAILALAREQGFINVGIELSNDRGGAGARNADAPLLRN